MKNKVLYSLRPDWIDQAALRQDGTWRFCIVEMRTMNYALEKQTYIR